MQKKCPKCGIKSPRIKAKEILTGCVGLVILVFILGGLLSMCSSEESVIASPQPKPMHDQSDINKPAMKSDIGVRTNDFDTRFNAAAQEFQSKYRINSHHKNYMSSGSNDTEITTFRLDDSFGILILRRRANKKIVSITAMADISEDASLGISEDASLGISEDAFVGLEMMIAALQPHLTSREQASIYNSVVDSLFIEENVEIEFSEIKYTSTLENSKLLFSAESSNNL